jgi:hypothetical protein
MFYVPAENRAKFWYAQFYERFKTSLWLK